MFGFIVVDFCCVLRVPAITSGLQIRCPYRGLRLPKDGTLKLGATIWVPGIKLAKCPIVQGFASSLLGTQLPVTLAVAFYKAYLLVSTAFSCYAGQAL